ncbi:MAG TPA: RDD family protein [Saprospiraceae bacterium]|mgnify:CR=1 FL=1|jgi:uncharacterized RDD family membrane protein YckC|nr:RDD family protein [Saprospiraceae bacterium]HUN16113.1 RDD family protein [Saprospiraceae bacterium]
MENLILDDQHQSRQLNYAGFWIRVGAYLIDCVVLMVGQILLFIPSGVGMESLLNLGIESESLPTSFWISYFALVAFGILYFVLMESSKYQGTLGKLAFGLKVGNEDGTQISFSKALGRYFAKIVSALILLIGFIMVAFDKKKQGLHDKMANTIVYTKN